MLHLLFLAMMADVEISPTPSVPSKEIVDPSTPK
jgi:hypothetical protein